MALVMEGPHGDAWRPFVTVKLVFLDAEHNSLGHIGKVHCFEDGSASRRWNNWHFVREAGQTLETATPLDKLGRLIENADGTSKYELPPPLRTPEDWMKIMHIIREENWCPYTTGYQT
ncbi:hypothetical protein DM02DRAFT_623561 [Periconia macrospinosa]|uniref:Uncharacterized protein n=1 Tax=Periconia macrospinosa TaxID=97972 RepID=A0A2V1E5K5_9PLEO|nr:hypothetical protein DM02DRAFT_623561 [Periconia macrospinosa]